MTGGRHIARPGDAETLCREPADGGAFRWRPGAPFMGRMAADPRARGMTTWEFCGACVETHQEAEHARLCLLIAARLRFYGRASAWLGKQVISRWQTTCEWEMLSLDYKQRVLDEIETWVNEEARGAAA